MPPRVEKYWRRKGSARAPECNHSEPDALGGTGSEEHKT